MIQSRRKRIIFEKIAKILFLLCKLPETDKKKKNLIRKNFIFKKNLLIALFF